MPTVNGTFLHVTGAALLGAVVRIESLSGPTVSGSAIASDAYVDARTDSSGNISVSLVGGDYQATWSNPDGGGVNSTIRFSVPSSGGPYRLESLVSSDLTFTYAFAPQYALKSTENGSYRITGSGMFQLWNPTTAKWHSAWITGAENALRWAFGPGET